VAWWASHPGLPTSPSSEETLTHDFDAADPPLDAPCRVVNG
jgi:hypothetical protein